ncbi:Lin0368 family putative glycerol transporter subunit [Lacticigenium naphthae]|uniref:Lin0368 family putative glycerol transporter subunit n=1 Tax=Lacticigenium naphthae TaxID=515351 RepID=UPI0004274CB7|nr:hypothetical protein [Lacticigenium naphthae]
MNFLRNALFFGLAGFIVISLWDYLTLHLGIFGGVLAAGLGVGTMWFFNHHLGLIGNQPYAAFVDMGLGISMTALFRDTFIFGWNALGEAVPTILLVIVGAVIGGSLAYKIEIHYEKKLSITQREPDINFNESEGQK